MKRPVDWAIPMLETAEEILVSVNKLWKEYVRPSDFGEENERQLFDAIQRSMKLKL